MVSQQTDLKFYFVVGESSGDVLGDELIQALREIRPDFEAMGICGPQMRKNKIKTFFPMEKLQVMGFVNIFLSFPKLFWLFHRAKKDILKQKPHAVIFIDYPGFNLRLAKTLRQKGFQGKLVHYVCPSVWAWGKKRIPKMAERLDLLLSILPFEKKIFDEFPLKVSYIGHPLADKIQRYSYDSTWSIETERKILSIFPGSRKSEILENFPLQLETAVELAKEKDLDIVVSIAHENLSQEIKRIAKSHTVFFVPALKRYELMKKTYLALATSGTVTLELAMHQVPTVITYSLKKFDQFLAQKIFHIDLPFYTLPNIILSKEVFSELIGPYCTKDNVKKCLLALLSDHRRRICQKDCKNIFDSLKEKRASLQAAKEIYCLYGYV